MKISLLVLFLILLNTYSYADELPFHNISLCWSYEHRGDKILKGFKLYKNNVPLCTTHIPTMRNMNCSFYVNNGPAVFTLTAIFADDSESPKSTKYELMLGEDTMEIPVMKIKFYLM